MAPLISKPFADTARVIVGSVAGFFYAMSLLSVGEKVLHELFPVPASLDWSDRDAVLAWQHGLPIGAHLLTLLIWVGGTFFGCVLAVLFARHQAKRVLSYVGTIFVAVFLMLFLLTPFPAWLSIVAMCGIAGAIWGTWKLFGRMDARPGGRDRT